jgi:hypothetical protein
MIKGYRANIIRSEIHEESNYDPRCPFKLVTTYINNTDHDITIMGRTNIPITFPKRPPHLGINIPRETSFIIRTTYILNNHNDIIRFANNLSKYKQNSNIDNGDLTIIYDALAERLKNGQMLHTFTVTVERLILSEVLYCGYPIYISDSDLLVTVGEYNVNMIHPYSDNGILLDTYVHVVQDKKITGVIIEVIDNENEIGDRFVCLGKRMFRIPPKRDESLKSGVYVTNMQQNVTNMVEVEPIYYEFDEASEAIGLYKTKEEAQTYGNPEYVAKLELKENEQRLLDAKNEFEVFKTATRQQELTRLEELAQLKHENDLIKMQLAQVELTRSEEITNLKHEQEVLRTNLKQQEITRQEEYNRIKHEQDLDVQRIKEKATKIEEKATKKKKKYEKLKFKLDTRKARREDYYEEVSSTRKSNNELIKYAPVILIGLINAFALFSKR